MSWAPGTPSGLAMWRWPSPIEAGSNTVAATAMTTSAAVSQTSGRQRRESRCPSGKTIGSTTRSIGKPAAHPIEDASSKGTTHAAGRSCTYSQWSP